MKTYWKQLVPALAVVLVLVLAFAALNKRPDPPPEPLRYNEMGVYVYGRNINPMGPTAIEIAVYEELELPELGLVGLALVEMPPMGFVAPRWFVGAWDVEPTWDVTKRYAVAFRIRPYASASAQVYYIDTSETAVNIWSGPDPFEWPATLAIHGGSGAISVVLSDALLGILGTREEGTTSLGVAGNLTIYGVRYFEPATWGYIWARVAFCEDQTPQPGETVHCNEYTATTDSDGYAVFCVPPGYYEVWWDEYPSEIVAGWVPPGFGAGFIDEDCPLPEPPTPDLPGWVPPTEPPEWWPEPWPWPVIPEEPGPYDPENPWPTPEPPWEESPQPRPDNPPPPGEPPPWWPRPPYWEEPWPWPIPGWERPFLRSERYGFSLKNPQVGW